MSDTHPQRSVLWPALRRFWPVALLTAVVAGVSASLLLQVTSSPSVVAQASYVVPVAPPVAPTLPGQVPPTPSSLPSSPGAASDYAEVYAVLLTNDAAVLAALSQASGLDVDEIPDAVQALVPVGGSVVRVSVTTDTREQAEAFLTGLDTLLSASTSVTPNIPAGNLVPLGRGAVVESEGLAPLAPVLGAIVGLLLGVGAAVVLERGDSRVRSGEDIRALADWPVLSLSHDPDDPRAEVVTERVRRSAPGLAHVALVSPRGGRLADLEDLAWVLEEADRVNAGAGAVRWTVAGVLRGEGDTEQRAQEADGLLLVVPARSPMRHLTTAVRAVEDLGVEPVVVAIPTRRKRGRPARQAPQEHADAVSSDDGAGLSYPPPHPSDDPSDQPARDTLSGGR